MSKFTQGKWKLSNGGHVYVEGTSTMIADVRRITSSDLEPSDILEQSFANARLIANAPRMYELLNMSLGYIHQNIILRDAIMKLLARIDGEKEDNHA